MKKTIFSFLTASVTRISSVSFRPVIFLVVVGVAVVASNRIEPACADACTRPPLFACPPSIVVWSNVTIPFYAYGQGLLPNGHEYCAYYAPASPSTGGDTFGGVFDRVQGEQVTFARDMGPETCEDSWRNDGQGGTESRGTECYRIPNGNAYEMSITSQGSKCLDINFWDPYISPNGGVGTHSNFFIHDDCEKALYTFYALGGQVTPLQCISTFLEQGSTGRIVYRCGEFPSYYSVFTRRYSVTPSNICVDVGFD